MPLILAIEPDRRQAAHLTAVVRRRVSAELILVGTTEGALNAIGNRVPDLVLVPALLSPQDDAALAAALRVIAAAARVQMLTIPVLGAPRPASRVEGVLSAFRRGRSRAAEPEGCDPGVFAEQIASYLERAAQERASTDADMPDDDAAAPEIVAVVEETARTVEASEPADAIEMLEEFETFDAMETFDVIQTIEATDLVDEAGPATDESVSIALEEAVRALFSDTETEAASPMELPVPVAEAPALVAEPLPAPPVDEWAAVQELMAALGAIPLAAIEATDEGDWAPPVEESDPVIKQPAAIIDEPEDDDSEVVAEPPPLAAKSEREWVALIESLRHDVARLRTERAEKPAPRPAAAPRAAKPSKKKAKAVQDEWGFFDPEQCGFAALLAKLDEVTEADEGRI